VLFAAATLSGQEHGTQEDIGYKPLALLAAYVFLDNGSGVVISADGDVLTNHHVIEDATTVDVRYINGVKHTAHLLGVDPIGDIALLHIDHAQNLAFASLASAQEMRVGAPVIAIGNPFGLGDLDDIPTLTRGVLSALHLVRGNYTDALQSDAPINPGNSGGPLFDEQGQLLGINGQIRTISGMRINSGIGLAIASTQLDAFLPFLRSANGRIVHHTTMPKGLQLVDDGDAVRVTGIPQAPSALQVGDILLSLDGRAAISTQTCHGLFQSLPFQQDAHITAQVRRAGQLLELAVAVDRQVIPGNPYHGLGFTDASGRLVVDSVDQDSPASTAAIAVGEQVLSVNQHALSTQVDWLRALQALEVGDALALVVQGKDGVKRDVRLILVNEH
jgi:S1-C subfamily serine protease